MSISSPFIHRPVATTLLTIGVAIAGAIAFKVLPIAPLPQVDFPTISVNSSLPGASAEIMASSVATPLERQFGHIAGVSEMTSASSLGSTSVTIQFDLSRDIDGAARDVEAGINAARAYLPANLPSNPSYRKVNPADSPIMIHRPHLRQVRPGETLRRGLHHHGAEAFAGAGRRSGQSRRRRAAIRPRRCESHAAGQLRPDPRESPVSSQPSEFRYAQAAKSPTASPPRTSSTTTRFPLADDYKPLVVGYHHGAAIRLSDVANVTDSVQNVRTGGFLNGKRAVIADLFFASRAPTLFKPSTTSRPSFLRLKASIPLRHRRDHGARPHHYHSRLHQSTSNAR